MDDPTPNTISLNEVRSQVLTDISSDRKGWRWTEVPQIIILFILVTSLLFITSFGLYTAIRIIKAGVDVADIGKVIQVFVTGSSSLLGFVVIKLMPMLGTKSLTYLKVERRFTSDLNLVRIAPDEAAIQEFLKGYYNIKN